MELCLVDAEILLRDRLHVVCIKFKVSFDMLALLVLVQEVVKGCARQISHDTSVHSDESSPCIPSKASVFRNNRRSDGLAHTEIENGIHHACTDTQHQTKLKEAKQNEEESDRERKRTKRRREELTDQAWTQVRQIEPTQAKDFELHQI